MDFIIPDVVGMSFQIVCRLLLEAMPSLVLIRLGQVAHVVYLVNTICEFICLSLDKISHKV
jgi:hypothetical protein